jgi:ABC-type ATPase involved in cell division
MTTHNQEIVNKLQRRVITIDGGKVSQDIAGRKL